MAISNCLFSATSENHNYQNELRNGLMQVLHLTLSLQVLVILQ